MSQSKLSPLPAPTIYKFFWAEEQFQPPRGKRWQSKWKWAQTRINADDTARSSCARNRKDTKKVTMDCVDELCTILVHVLIAL